jgi:hypothetical protein
VTLRTAKNHKTGPRRRPVLAPVNRAAFRGGRDVRPEIAAPRGTAGGAVRTASRAGTPEILERCGSCFRGSLAAATRSTSLQQDLMNGRFKSEMNPLQFFLIRLGSTDIISCNSQFTYYNPNDIFVSVSITEFPARLKEFWALKSVSIADKNKRNSRSWAQFSWQSRPLEDFQWK